MISKLKEEIKDHEEEKAEIEFDLNKVREMMKEQQSQVQQRYEQELEAKLSQINTL